MLKFERGVGIKQGIRDFKANPANISAGITGMVFSVSGIFIIYSNIASDAGLNQAQALSWLMTGLFIGALLSIGFSLHYKMPIVFTASLPAMALVGSLYHVFDISTMVGGFIMSGVLILLVGLSGLMDFLKRILPIPIVMGMISGIFMSYALKIVFAVQSDLLVCGLVVLIYFLVMGFLPKVPPQMLALAAAVVLVLLFRPLSLPAEGLEIGFAPPIFVMPTFSIEAFFSISIPIALLALTDCVKGFGVLKANGYEAPMNSLVTASGLATMLAGFSMSHAINFAGVGTAIVATDAGGAREYRYAASVMKNIFSVCLAFTVGLIYPLLNSLPVTVSDVLAGLAMLSLFISSLKAAYGSGKFVMGSFVAMAVGLADVTIGSIGAPVWALLAGVLVSLLVERKDFSSRG